MRAKRFVSFLDDTTLNMKSEKALERSSGRTGLMPVMVDLPGYAATGIHCCHIARVVAIP
jgi:hypothetical protein